MDRKNQSQYRDAHVILVQYVVFASAVATASRRESLLVILAHCVLLHNLGATLYVF